MSVVATSSDRRKPQRFFRDRLAIRLTYAEPSLTKFAWRSPENGFGRTARACWRSRTLPDGFAVIWSGGDDTSDVESIRPGTFLLGQKYCHKHRVAWRAVAFVTVTYCDQST